MLYVCADETDRFYVWRVVYVFIFSKCISHELYQIDSPQTKIYYNIIIYYILL